MDTEKLLCSLGIDRLKAELNPICLFLALLPHHILHVGRIRVKELRCEDPDGIQLHVDWIQKRVLVTTVVMVVVTYQWELFHNHLQDSGFEGGLYCPQLPRGSPVFTLYGS